MTPRRQPSPSRLYRDPANRILLGVCAGIADYFGLPSLWVRAACVFGVLVFTWRETPRLCGQESRKGDLGFFLSF